MDFSANSTISSETYTSSLLDEFTMGSKKMNPDTVSQYVCHTSTIPFCTTIDLDFERKNSQNPTEYFAKEYHGPSHKHVGNCPCNKNYCMFVNKNKEFYDNYISPTCPCREYSTKEVKLTPLCYLTFLKSMSHNLTSAQKSINPEQVLFCPDARSIFDNKYPVIIKEKLNVSGFGHLTRNTVIPVLNKLYWFRVYGKKYRLQQEVERSISIKGNFPNFLQDLKQSLHSINGLLIKKFMALGPECVSYKKIAEQTARLFRDFILDYTSPTRLELPIQAQDSIYEDCKDFFNYIKENHEAKNFDKRISLLNYEFKNRSLGTFFGTELRRLQSMVIHRTNMGLGDYTQTLAWDFRCVELCQTRNLGYLPYYIAREKAAEWRDVVNRDVEDVSTEVLQLIKGSIHQELGRANVPRDLLSGDTIKTEQLIEESVSLELKYTASARSTRSEGGKPEDARFYLSQIRMFGWRVPIRDLDTFEVIGMTPKLSPLVEDNDDGFNLSSIIFWFSLQNILNWILERKLLPPKDRWYYRFLDNEGNQHRINNIMDAVVILINEPGKGRKLVKSHPILNWFLIPGSKMCQKILAYHPDHKAGLELGSHDWVHSKRTSGDSMESDFMFDSITGRIRPEINSAYTDWTEATDRMKKRLGIAHLRGFFEYISFPRVYGILIQIMIREPQPIKEVVQLTSLDEFENRETIIMTGFIREGFMMGNQMTKTILHLAHISERGISEKFLEERGINVIRNNGYGRIRRNIGQIPYGTEPGVGRIKILPKRLF